MKNKSNKRKNNKINKNNMNFDNKIIKNIQHNLNNSLSAFLFYRQLQLNSNDTTKISMDAQKNQLKDLYIYLGVLAGIIIFILVGYSFYKKCMEKKALREIEQENINMELFQNSISIRNGPSQEMHRPYSFNNPNHNYNSDIIHNFQNNDNSFEINHEERMENIRKKYGNSLLIKILLKKQIKEVVYNQALGEEFGDNCTICMDNFPINIIICQTPCEHLFHKTCFDKYLRGIKDTDKLTCPNCNQNLLISKKFLKLRLKTEKVKIDKKDINKIKEKEKENKFDKDKIKYEQINNEEIKNNNSAMTNKNNENDNNIPNNPYEIIVIKKKFQKNKDDKTNKSSKVNSDVKGENNTNKDLNVNNNSNNIYIPGNQSNNKKNCIIIENEENKQNKENSVKEPSHSINGQNNKMIHLNKKKIGFPYNGKESSSSYSKELSSERQAIYKKATLKGLLSTSKQEN